MLASEEDSVSAAQSAQTVSWMLEQRRWAMSRRVWEPWPEDHWVLLVMRPRVLLPWAARSLGQVYRLLATLQEMLKLPRELDSMLPRMWPEMLSLLVVQH